MIIDQFEMPLDARLGSKQGGGVRYPFEALAVGQGFTIAGDENKLRSVASAASRFKSNFKDRTLQIGRTEGAMHFKRIA